MITLMTFFAGAPAFAEVSVDVKLSPPRLNSGKLLMESLSEGLATVALGWIDKPKLKQIMGLEKIKKIMLCQPVGYKK